MRLTALIAWMSLPLSAWAFPKPVVMNAVPDVYTPIAAEQQKLGGMLAARMRANTEGYLEHVDAKLLVPSTSSFTPKTIVDGEQTGRFLAAAAAAYNYSHDPELKALMDRAAASLVGRLSPVPALDSPEAVSQLGEPEFEAARQVLLGLLSYYQLTGDERASGACNNLSAMVLNARNQSSAILLLEPMIQLYRYTGESTYLGFSRYVADAWLQSEQASDDPSETEMRLAAFLGMAEIYRISAVDAYLRAALSGWKELRDSRVSVTGIVLAQNRNSQATDCSDDLASDWVRLTLSLLRLTGEPQYADQAERTIYNHLFAAQNPADGRLSPAVPPDGSKTWAPEEKSCIRCEARALGAIPDATWGLYRRGLVVYLYNSGRGTVHLRRRGTVQLFSEAAFPENGQVLFHVEPDRPLRFPVRLRVPIWAKNFVVDIGASHLDGRPGDLLTFSREWKRGDVLRINFDLPVQAINGPASDTNRIALQRGPQLLVLEKAFNPHLENLEKASVALPDTSDIKLMPAELTAKSRWPGDQVYGLDGEYDGGRTPLMLVPLADAIQYRLWINRKNASHNSSKTN